MPNAFGYDEGATATAEPQANVFGHVEKSGKPNVFGHVEEAPPSVSMGGMRMDDIAHTLNKQREVNAVDALQGGKGFNRATLHAITDEELAKRHRDLSDVASQQADALIHSAQAFEGDTPSHQLAQQRLLDTAREHVKANPHDITNAPLARGIASVPLGMIARAKQNSGEGAREVQMEKALQIARHEADPYGQAISGAVGSALSPQFVAGAIAAAPVEGASMIGSMARGAGVFGTLQTGEQAIMGEPITPVRNYGSAGAMMVGGAAAAPIGEALGGGANTLAARAIGGGVGGLGGTMAINAAEGRETTNPEALAQTIIGAAQAALPHAPYVEHVREAMKQGKTPEESHAIANELTKETPTAQPAPSVSAPAAESAKEVTNAESPSVRNPSEAGNVARGANEPAPAPVVEPSVPEVVEGKGESAGNKPGNVDVTEIPVAVKPASVVPNEPKPLKPMSENTGEEPAHYVWEQIKKAYGGRTPAAIDEYNNWLAGKRARESEAQNVQKPKSEGEVPFRSEAPQVREGVRGGNAQEQEAPLQVPQGESRGPAKPARENAVSEGPGAAQSTDPAFKPTIPTGIKNATVARERESIGLPPREKGETVHDEPLIDAAVKRHFNEPQTGRQLVEDLKENPRTVSKEEVADLLVYRRSLLNERTRLNDAYDAASDPAERALVHAQLRDNYDRLNDASEATEKAGTEQGLAFRARRWMMNEGFTLAEMEHAIEREKGEPLTPQEHEEIKKLHTRIDTVQKAFDDYVKNKESGDRTKTLTGTHEETVKDVEKEKYRESVKGEQRDIPAEKTAILDRMKERIADGDSKADLKNLIRRLHRLVISEGVTDREKAVDAVHNLIKGVVPDITRNDTMDLMSGYGDFKPLSKDAISVTQRAHRGELQQLSKLRDLMEKQRALKSGMERAEPTDEQRKLTKRVNDLMKKLGIHTTDPERQIKSTLDAMKTRWKNAISDMADEIASGKKMVREKGTIPLDDEAKALKERYQQAKTEYDKAFPKEALTQQEQIERAIKGEERQIAEYDRQLGEGVVKKLANPSVDSPELNALRAQKEAARQRVQLLRDLIGQDATQQSRIAELEKRRDALNAKIAAGDISTKESVTKTESPEIEALRKQVKTASDTLNQLRADAAKAEAAPPAPGMSGLKLNDVEQRVEAARNQRVKQLEESIAKISKRIADKDVGRKPTQPGLDSPEIAALTRQRELLLKALAGVRSEANKKPFAQTQAEARQRRIKQLEKSIADAQGRIAKGDVLPKQGPPRFEGPEIEALKSQSKQLSETIAKMRDERTPKKSKEEIALQAKTTQLANRLGVLAEKVVTGDYSPARPREGIKLDTKALALEAEVKRWQKTFERERQKYELRNRPAWVKGLDFVGKWARASALSSPTTFAKLFAATVEQGGFKIADEAVGGIINKIPGISGIAEKAPSEGAGLNVRAYAKSVAKALTQGIVDAKATLKTGIGDLDAKFGKDRLPPDALEFFGLLHGAEKAPLKRFAFEYSLEKRLSHLGGKGLDISDPAVQERAMLDAYKDANRTLFQEDNRLVKAYNAFLATLEAKGKNEHPSLAGKAGASALRTALPVVKVGTNIVAQGAERLIGLPVGTVEALRAIARGTERLKPEEADMILRHIKKGSVGSAALLAGFLGASAIGGYYQKGEKRDPADVDPGEIRAGGLDIPKLAMHNPVMEMLQLGSTARRVADSMTSKKKDAESKGLGAGALAGALGLAEELPFVNEASRLVKATEPGQTGNVVGQGASVLIPQFIQWIARQSDKATPFNPSEDTTKRKPSGAIENIEMGIPGLRGRVPEAKKHK